MRNCLTDEGGPFEVGLQERTSNRLSAAMDKSRGRERERKRPSEDWVRYQARRGLQGNHYRSVESDSRRCQNRGVVVTAGQSSDGTCLRAGRHPA